MLRMAFCTEAAVTLNSPAISAALIQMFSPVARTSFPVICIISRFMAYGLEGVYNIFIDAVEPCRQVVHVTVQFFLCHLRIDLSGFYALVSQYGTDRFDGHPVGKEYGRGRRMTAQVPSDVLRYP